jgi:TetR/AcrR family transcriptional regulator, cholesterol catabolism regulator
VARWRSVSRANGTVGRQRSERSERSEEVYVAALRLFREKGYHATSMQDIAAAVGLYKGSLYHYIGGKEDLLVRVFERAMGALLADVERVASDAALAPSEQLRRIVEAHVLAVSTNLDALTVYLHEWRSLAGEALVEVRRQRERYLALVTGVVRRGISCGEFGSTDARVATFAVLGMCNWLCQWYRPEGRLSAAEIGRAFGDVVLGGLLLRSEQELAEGFAQRVDEAG